MDVPRLSMTVRGYEKPTDDQASAIRAFMSARDVFVMLPTGSGKSLCFVALPMLFDSIRNLADSNTILRSSIVVVVSPLTVLMKDQVSKYSRSGVLRCAYFGEAIDNCSKQGLLRGDYQLVYISPEALLAVTHWREILYSEVYQQNTFIASGLHHRLKTWCTLTGLLCPTVTYVLKVAFYHCIWHAINDMYVATWISKNIL